MNDLRINDTSLEGDEIWVLCYSQNSANDDIHKISATKFPIKQYFVAESFSRSIISHLGASYTDFVVLISDKDYDLNVGDDISNLINQKKISMVGLIQRPEQKIKNDKGNPVSAVLGRIP